MLHQISGLGRNVRSLFFFHCCHPLMQMLSWNFGFHCALSSQFLYKGGIHIVLLSCYDSKDEMSSKICNVMRQKWQLWPRFSALRQDVFLPTSLSQKLFKFRRGLSLPFPTWILQVQNGPEIFPGSFLSWPNRKWNKSLITSTTSVLDALLWERSHFCQKNFEHWKKDVTAQHGRW